MANNLSSHRKHEFGRFCGQQKNCCFPVNVGFGGRPELDWPNSDLSLPLPDFEHLLWRRSQLTLRSCMDLTVHGMVVSFWTTGLQSLFHVILITHGKR